ncbi:hypothetical protein GLOTRDRAFT_93620 [Gloeophyllum trabeum ATCC 11539]|uniref:Uncharacterized protein n=1 Tax=Gloeophyllum trabeum (strain ATCC 11539 / FP-39264 / Madison 617) TaxID=670483 RepID=S7Q6D1_GLOTA|nr:uncharacterized protein GLOTRDRAFT_93620 [Gloeophyllum trabeum ATCC 11539]EPQ55062.1 hypothetical protein GLOTRDRAFT_93620 [Gloeophyllum trabeum ATCC 11539]
MSQGLVDFWQESLRASDLPSAVLNALVTKEKRISKDAGNVNVAHETPEIVLGRIESDGHVHPVLQGITQSLTCTYDNGTRDIATYAISPKLCVPDDCLRKTPKSVSGLTSEVSVHGMAPRDTSISTICKEMKVLCMTRTESGHGPVSVTGASQSPRLLLAGGAAAEDWVLPNAGDYADYRDQFVQSLMVLRRLCGIMRTEDLKMDIYLTLALPLPGDAP